MAEIQKCLCGGTPEFIKLYAHLRYDGFVKCPRCGYESKVYVSKQGAVNAWNNTMRKIEGKNNE